MTKLTRTAGPTSLAQAHEGGAFLGRPREACHTRAGLMDDEDSKDLARKRTARVQLANGAIEARAYVAPTPIPADLDHKTIEMQTVAVDASLDPRRKATVARGMGEAVAVLEGEIVDPATGQIIPAVDAMGLPNTPWVHGKRPTHLKGAAPLKIGAAGAGLAPGLSAAGATRPGYFAYFAAGGIVIAAIACAGIILSTRGNTKGADPASSASPPAPPAATTARVLEPPRAPDQPVIPPPPTSAEPTPLTPATGKPGGMLPGRDARPSAPTAPSPPPAKSNDRIF